MSAPVLAPAEFEEWPDHKQLPCEDGSIVENSQEHSQSNMLSDSVAPRLIQVFGEQGFYIGTDTGIYWRNMTPPLEGCKSPDWYVVPGVTPMLDGELRRSYVMWREFRRPLIVIEYVSGTGAEEHDATPLRGKFWVYEQGLAVPYYFIFDGFRGTLEAYRLEGGAYHRMEPNQHGRYPIPPLRIELGMWEGTYRRYDAIWLRAWDADTGELMPVSEERLQVSEVRAALAEDSLDHFQELAAEAVQHAAAERQRADEAARLADAERQRADDAARRARLLEEKLRAAGIDPVA